MTARSYLLVSCITLNLLIGSSVVLAQPSVNNKPSSKQSGKVEGVAFDDSGQLYVGTNKMSLHRSSPPPITGVLPKSLEAPSPKCGVNALYVFLRLHNVSCSYEDLSRELPLEEKGANMLDLKIVSHSHGCEAEVIQIGPFQLAAKLPAVARLASVSTQSEGHFVVVTKMSDSNVYVVDSTAGGLIKMPRGVFEREFSGYALVHGGSWLQLMRSRLNVILGIVDGFGAIIILGIIVYRMVRKHLSPRL